MGKNSKNLKQKSQTFKGTARSREKNNSISADAEDVFEKHRVIVTTQNGLLLARQG